MPNNTLIQQRNGSIDLLKILAIFLIVISHFVPKYMWNGNELLCGYIDTTYASTDFTVPIMTLYNICGSIGNDLFLVSAAWFLLDSKHCNVKRLLSLEVDVIFLSILWLCITLVFGLPVPQKHIIYSLFPILKRTYWFFSCYVLFYFLHPAYNTLLDKLNRRQLLGIDLLLLFLYSIMQFVVPNSYYFTPLMGFTTIYFVSAYNKRYLPKFSQNRKANGILIAGCIACLIAFVYLNNFIGLRIYRYSYEMARWTHYMNLFVILLSIGLLNFFRSFFIKSTALIRHIAALSMVIYVMTESRFMMYYFKPWFYDWIYGRFNYDYIWLYVPLASVVAFFVSAGAGTLYQLIFSHPRDTLVKILMLRGKQAWDWLANKLLQFE